MPKAECFILKDTDPEIIEAAEEEPHGRTYSSSYRDDPGSVRIEEVVNGMKYACISITNDEEGTLAQIGQANPWHIEALKIITGSEEDAHKPLTDILNDHFDLTLDKHIDVTGMSPNWAILDTQGYIAHNDTTIVLAYRCTTSIQDWLTNFSTTSSAWEIEEDLAQGHAGYFSGLEGFSFCCFGEDKESKPRVHTGFYNNFLATIPIIKEVIDPLLAPDEPPRNLYVVGHSLGGGIAVLATCFYLLEYDWANLPHRLISVTAGPPRSIQNSMFDIVNPKITELRYLDKAVVSRIVCDMDIVPKVPPTFFGFRHIGKMVYITEDEYLLVNPSLSPDHTLSEDEMKELSIEREEEEEEEEEENVEERSEYEQKVYKLPKAFRDHMPDFILNPLLKIFHEEYD